MKQLLSFFEHPEFGSVRSVLLDGNPYFVGRDVATCLKYERPSEAVTKYCKKFLYAPMETDSTGKKSPNFSKISITPIKSIPENQQVRLIGESDLYRLIMRSTLPSAEKFQDWVVEDVLPSIRKKGIYEIKNNTPFKNIERHTDRAVQVTNSKQVNGYNFLKGGVQAVIEHNVENCVVHTGKTPSEIKQLAKEWNVPSKHRSSAKEVMRKYHPEVACSMSVADEFVRLGKDSHDAAIMCKEHAVPLFKEMLAYNMIDASQA